MSTLLEKALEQAGLDGFVFQDVGNGANEGRSPNYNFGIAEITGDSGLVTYAIGCASDGVVLSPDHAFVLNVDDAVRLLKEAIEEES